MFPPPQAWQADNQARSNRRSDKRTRFHTTTQPSPIVSRLIFLEPQNRNPCSASVACNQDKEQVRLLRVHELRDPRGLNPDSV